jgi:hypothetical protein
VVDTGSEGSAGSDPADRGATRFAADKERDPDGGEDGGADTDTHRGVLRDTPPHTEHGRHDVKGIDGGTTGRWSQRFCGRRERGTTLTWES